MKNLMNFRWRATGRIFFISLNLFVLCKVLEGQKDICLHFRPFFFIKKPNFIEIENVSSIHNSDEFYLCTFHQKSIIVRIFYEMTAIDVTFDIAFNSRIKALCSPSTSKSPLIIFFWFTHETMWHKMLSYMRSIVVCWMGSIDPQ